jgi:hypothetical protein
MPGSTTTGAESPRASRAPVLVRLGVVAAYPGWTVAALLASYVVFAARLFRFVDRHAVDVLFRDQWHILSPKFEGKGLWAMIRLQVGPHRQGLGGLWLDAVYTATRWNVRTDCFLTAGVLVVAAALALDVKRRLSGGLDLFDAALAPLFLGLASFELFAVTPNPAHGALPLLLAVAAAWALARDSWWLIALVGVLASHTGFATYLAAVAAGLGILVAIRDRSAAALAATAAIVAALCLFFVGYRFVPAIACFQFPHPRPAEYIWFAGLLLVRPFAHFQTTGAFARAGGGLAACAGIALGALALVRALGPREDSRIWRVAALLIGFSLLFGASTAVGRVCAGLDGALVSRYVPYALPFWFAVYLLLRRRSPGASPGGTAIAALLLAAFVAKEADPTMNESTARSYSEPKKRWRACYLRRHDWRACDAETSFPINFSDESLDSDFEFLRKNRLSVYRDDSAAP